MASRPFVRQLGFQPGVQLNPLIDQTDGVAPDLADQWFAAVARLTRGRIDRAFVVNAGNLLAKTGPAASIGANQLNEAKVQIYEALNNGAQGAVISRLVPAAAAKFHAWADLTGAAANFGTSVGAPTNNYSLWVLDHECHNAGIKIAVHADSTPVGGTAQANPLLTLRVMDADGVLRYSFTGSVDPSATDDENKSIYLPDVVASLTDNIEVGVNAAFTGVGTTSDAYGRASDGADKWATSAVLATFSEGGATYAATDYDAAVDRLRKTSLSFGYLISGGSQVMTLLSKLASLAKEINTPFKYDISGKLAPDAAIAMRNSLGVDSHLVHAYWAPLAAIDPLNGGKVVWGATGLNVGYSCARNARRNAKGFAPKNYAIAGKEYPVERTSIAQIYEPTQAELSDLARAQINPVIFETYNGGGRYVFNDVLTQSKSLVSYKKLVPISEMSVTVDQMVATVAKEWLFLPMSDYVRRMNEWLPDYLGDAQSSDWLVPSEKLPGNAAFTFSVIPDEIQKADKVHITYWLSFDGTVRQVVLQQILTR
jgi:hypothetical protein